jgi:hypothetical protein
MSIDAKVINFKKAIREKKAKSFVYERFQDYTDEYDQLSDPTIREKLNHRDLFFLYTKYMSKSDENKRDVQMHYKKEDRGKDYFEHLDPEDIPESEK